MRIRTIKPEFFTHEGLYDLEASVKLPIRVAYIGLTALSDDAQAVVVEVFEAVGMGLDEFQEGWGCEGCIDEF